MESLQGRAPRTTVAPGEGAFLLALVLGTLAWSGIAPTDRLTWLLEVIWVIAAVPLILWLRGRFDLSRQSVLGSGGTGAVIASFATSTRRDGRAASEQSGDIRFDLLREDGILRIHQVRHDPR